MPLDLKQMERDILETVHTQGKIGMLDGTDWPGTKFLIDKYRLAEQRQQLTVLMKYLLERRYLFPYFDGKTGRELSDYARGLTPKGYKRLRELQSPGRTWFKNNWFPALIAGITAVIGLGAIATELYLNWE